MRGKVRIAAQEGDGRPPAWLVVARASTRNYVVFMRDPFEVLGLSQDATPREVKSAWRRLARAYHPDVNSDSDAAERFRQITEAFEEAWAAAHRPRPTVRRRRWGLLGLDLNISVRPLVDDDLH